MMKVLCFFLASVSLVSTLSAQIQTVTVPINYSESNVSGNHRIRWNAPPIAPPSVPGLLVDYHWDITVDVSGTVTIYNPYSDDRVASGQTVGQTVWLAIPPNQGHGHWNQSFASGVIPPLGTETQAFSRSVRSTSRYSESNLSSVPVYYSFLAGVYEFNWISANWTFCVPGTQDCNYLFAPGYFSYGPLDITVSGSVTYEYLPTLLAVNTVCEGDDLGTELSLSGQWGIHVRAHTIHTGFDNQPLLLFRGTTTTNAFGSAFCIADGVRLNDSLAISELNYELENSTVIIGQPFVLQVASRQWDGSVRFTDAIAAFPY